MKPVVNVAAKLHATSVWALFVVLVAGGSIWLEMRVNLGLAFFGLWALLALVMLCIRRIRCDSLCMFGNLLVFGLLAYFIFGPAKLSSTPAAYVREGLMHSGWPLASVNDVLLWWFVGAVLLCAVLDLVHSVLHKRQSTSSQTKDSSKQPVDQSLQ